MPPVLKNFDQQLFLNEYWQKKPLLIKSGLPDWHNPITADELAGLSLEDDIESRLILSKPNPQQLINSQWSLEHGPFSEQRFSTLDEKNWTLLVQAVDHYAPEVAELLTYFGFIPGWQVDDVMVSYATQGGGVGPHFDRYDVFLVQGQGQREWQIGQCCDKQTQLQPDQALTLLTEFNVTETYELTAGDILYVPPYVAHWGTGLDNNCMTYSVGFRSPSQSEIIDDYTTFIQQQLSEDDRYRDTAVNGSGFGAIDKQTIDNIALMISEKLSNKTQLQQWFGRWASQTKYTDAIDEQGAANAFIIKSDAVINTIDFTNMEINIYRDTASRFYYMDADTKTKSPLMFFVNGREIDLGSRAGELETCIKRICNQESLTVEDLQPWLNHDKTKSLLAELFENGELYCADED